MTLDQYTSIIVDVIRTGATFGVFLALLHAFVGRKQ